MWSLALRTIQFIATTPLLEPGITLIHSAIKWESRLWVVVLIKRTLVLPNKESSDNVRQHHFYLGFVCSPGQCFSLCNELELHPVGSDLFDLNACLIYKKHLGTEKLTVA